MAGKAIQIIAGGIGVAAAAPFGVGNYTIVSQTAPPIITAGRLSQLADAVQSILAPDVLGGLQHFVVGQLSTTGGQDKNTIVGASLINTSVAAQGARMVMIGGNINQGAAASGVDDDVYIGWDFVLAAPGVGGTRGLNVGIGNVVTIQPEGGLGVSATANVVIGNNSIQTGSFGVTIGEGANGGAQNVTIGRQALAAGPTVSQAVSIGNGATVSDVNGIAVGRRARAALNSIAIGFFADAINDTGLVIGRDATNNAFDNVIVLGRGAAAGLANEAVIGGGASPFWSTQFRVGRVFADGGYPGLTWQLTSSNFAGVDQVAPPATIDCGTNTGAAAGGELRIRTGTIVASGGARQVLAERFAVLPSTGAAGSPGVRFSNVVTGAGVAAGTLGNAPSAGDPSFWLPVSIGGLVRYIPCWT